MNTIPLNIQIQPNDLNLNVGGGTTQIVPLQFDTKIQINGGEHYQGDYTFTPTNEAQIIDVHGLVVDEDITINPIPSNYGLIEWDGSVLTVS